MKQYISELIGTYLLVLVGCGAVVMSELHGSPQLFGITLTFGLVVLVMVYAFGKISGAHINPAVTIAFSYYGVFPKNKIFGYVFSQSLGAILASLTLSFILPSKHNYGVTSPSGSIIESFLIEILITFVLMFVILIVANDHKIISKLGGVIIGFTVFALAYLTGPISGASMNPARSLGPALISGQLDNIWIYLTAPIIGAITAVAIFKASKITV
jgi:aquaporin Z